MFALRTYRIIPALLALSLVLTAATPLVRSACDMAKMETKSCCDDSGEHAEMASMTGTDAPMSDISDAPCSDTSDAAAFFTTCCASADAPAVPTPERVQAPQLSLFAFAAAVFALPSEPSHPPRPLDTGPSAAPVALQILYGSFLI